MSCRHKHLCGGKNRSMINTNIRSEYIAKGGEYVGSNVVIDEESDEIELLAYWLLTNK